MSDTQQLQAWLVVFTPAFAALLAVAVLAVVAIVWDDYRQPR